MKRSGIVSTLAALSVAFLLPVGAHAATTPAKHATAKTATAAKSTSATTAKTASTTASNATASKPARHHTMARNASAAKAAVKTKSTKIDINTASREELMTLPGVDAAAADKIIAGRPYKNMAQLKTKGGLTNAEYRKVSRKVTAHQASMHSEAPANGTPNTESGAQSAGSEGAGGSSESSDNTTK